VPDVDEFPGHIACSSASRSEIVVPIFDRTGKPLAVLDIDSDKLNDFSDIDADGLEKIAALITGNVAH
jgi:GAF domain-containing protein